jgi:hypothetical protein
MAVCSMCAGVVSFHGLFREGRWYCGGVCYRLWQERQGDGERLRLLMRQRALVSHETAGDAEDYARKWCCCAFVESGRFLTCSRAYVCDCINAGVTIAVLCDHEAD